VWLISSVDEEINGDYFGFEGIKNSSQFVIKINTIGLMKSGVYEHKRFVSLF